MKHARFDYVRIQDPALENPSLLTPGSTAIGKDEPVFLLRAQDKHFCAMVAYYGVLIASDDSAEMDDEMVASIMRQVTAGSKWQRKNGCKAPDL